jgi:hypothetical protein
MAFTSTRIHQFAVPISATAALLGLATLALFAANKKSPPQSRSIIPSPRTTLLPRLSQAEASRLPYPPDILPGSRDVTTPYGTMRVYEWGPETGRKVIFCHGDGTPSPLFSSIAKDLVAKGCRVMLFGDYHPYTTTNSTNISHKISGEEATPTHPQTANTIPAYTPSKYPLLSSPPHSQPGQPPNSPS